MRELSSQETKEVNGGWVALAFAAARLGWALYRHYKTANAATWAARGVGIVGTTYQTMSALDPHKNEAPHKND
jgi:hypothetical protein